MNEIIYNFLWAGDKFIPEMHPQSGTVAKNKEKVQTFKEISLFLYFIINEL